MEASEHPKLAPHLCRMGLGFLFCFVLFVCFLPGAATAAAPAEAAGV